MFINELTKTENFSLKIQKEVSRKVVSLHPSIKVKLAASKREYCENQ